MIERHWKGIAKTDRAAEYIAHLQNETFKQVELIDGFISAKILKRSVDEGIEFLIITTWASFDSIRAFAGLQCEKAVVPQIVQEIMISYQDLVAHYEIV